MKILLINIDSKKIPNLALAKVEKYHRDMGDEVIWDFPLMRNQVDKIYVSCVFELNKQQCKQWEGYAEIGGSGYSLGINLPDEIEDIKPKINLGFTTRDCIRKCKFCIVPLKEGKIRIVGDLLDLWDGMAKDVTLLDNNILAVPEHFELVCKQARDNKIKIDFNQGLDHRLLTDKMAQTLKKTSTKEYRFSLDSPKNTKSAEKAISILKKAQINSARWYVLVGFDTTIEEDIERLNFLRSENQRVYVQRYNWSKDPRYIMLSEWGNQPQFFAKMSYEQFCQARKR